MLHKVVLANVLWIGASGVWGSMFFLSSLFETLIPRGKFVSLSIMGMTAVSPWWEARFILWLGIGTLIISLTLFIIGTALLSDAVLGLLVKRVERIEPIQWL